MAVLPSLKNEYINRLVTDSFSGYRHRLRIEEGELFDCKNLSTAHYPPALQPTQTRKAYRT